MKWNTLLSSKRSRISSTKNTNKKYDVRSEFEKDYHRIVGSASFRRLQDKTQVFPLDKSDFIRTRLTHSLEVSSFAHSLAETIGDDILKYHMDDNFTNKTKEDIGHILQCAGLIHDIGNPPFGHFGEEAIRTWFRDNLSKIQYKDENLASYLSLQMKEDLLNFEGNAQALRLVSKLHYLVDEHGMNLTYALLNTIIKYPVSSIEVDKHSGDIRTKKMGYNYADKDVFNDIMEETGTGGLRHPLTFILEAADDIAYCSADIEDAFVKGFLTYDMILREMEKCETIIREREKDGHPSFFYPATELKEFRKRGLKNDEENPDEYAVKNFTIRVQGFLIRCASYSFTKNYKAIMEGTYKTDLFEGTFAEGIVSSLKRFAYEEVFCSKFIYKMEIAEGVMMNFLLDKFVNAILYYEDITKQTDMDKRLIKLISSNYKRAYEVASKGKDEGERLYLRLLLVTDYICGMTDSFAKRLYQDLNGIN
ncbi:MAG: deoxyguanosinetriphosphate triphosphohydrolase [Lachnospiraceae bacterium]|jgi:dGTPase|nr:deoxyguanosinetriphosphate triphosphohydrolase [Lachnospiraceae bacterium]